MGYCMNQRGCSFKILKKNYKVCLEAIKAMDTNKGGGGITSNGVTTHSFAWVGTTNVEQANTLKAVFSAWRWDVYEDEKKKGIVNIEFTGEKMGDDAQLFQAIAPYVESGSYIEMSGEDGALWRWQFENGKFSENNALLDWECDGEIVEALLTKKCLLPTLLGIHPMLDRKIAVVLKGRNEYQ